MVDMGLKLRELREARGLNQTELGHLTGLDAAQICNIEKGRRTELRFTTVLALARGLGMTPMTLAKELGFEVDVAEAEVAEVEAAVIAARLCRMPQKTREAMSNLLTALNFELPMKAAADF